MTFGIVSALVFGLMTFCLATRRPTTLSHRMAWIPGVMAVMELSVCGIVFTAVPMALEVVLMVCRVTVLACCALALKRDAAKARNRVRRRRVQHRVAAERLLYELNGSAAHYCA